MVADDKHVQIFGYTHEDFQPYHIVTYCIDDTNQNQMLGKEEAKNLGDQSTMTEQPKNEENKDLQ